jgi:hypothetical protein
MIERTVEELTPIIGTRPACRAVGAAPATIYRRRRPPEPRSARPRPTPERALTGPERDAVLEVLHSAERFPRISMTFLALTSSASARSTCPTFSVLALKVHRFLDGERLTGR